MFVNENHNQNKLCEELPSARKWVVFTLGFQSCEKNLCPWAERGSGTAQPPAEASINRFFSLTSLAATHNLPHYFPTTFVA